MSTNSSVIEAYLQRELTKYLEELSRLCAQPSVAAKGEGIKECSELVASMLRERGFEVEILTTPGSPVVIGRMAGRSPRTLLCYNHYDVQPAEPFDLWTSPPFQPEIRDGKMYARGVVDDKGEIVARLAAIDALREANGGELPCGILFVIEGEEEIGSPNIEQFVQQHKDKLACDGSLWEGGGVSDDGRSVLALGYRGILSVRIEIETMTRDAHSGAAQILPSAAWRLVRLLSALKDENERILIPGFYSRALPPNEVDKEIIRSMPNYEERIRADYGISEFVLGRTGDSYRLSDFEPTCNIQGIESGWLGEGVKTVIPARASAKLDFRLVPDQNPDEIFEKLSTYLKEAGFVDAKLTRLGSMWPAKAPGDDPLAVLTMRTAEEVYGKPAVVIPLGGGSSPVYAFAGPLGVPVVNAGIGYSYARAHAPDENMRLEDFLKGALHVALVIDGFGDIGR